MGENYDGFGEINLLTLYKDFLCVLRASESNCFYRLYVFLQP